MRSTLSRSIAAVAAGAALSLSSAGVAFAETVENPIDDVGVDTSIGDDSAYNQEANWELWLSEVGFVGVECTKSDYNGQEVSTYTVPEQPSSSEEWALAVLKAGADPSTDGMTNDLFWYPEPGEVLEHNTGKGISHVIICSAEVEEETPTETETTPTETKTTPTKTKTTTTGTKTTSPATGPVVETDRPGGSGGAGLGLFGAAAALAAGAGALLLNRRRQSSEH